MDTPPGYTECFVAYVDLLGFSSLVEESRDQPDMVATLVTALNRIGRDTPTPTHMRACHDQAGKVVGYDTWVTQARPFSDCVCLFVPTVGGRLTWLLSSIRYVHDRMLELGLCIRGAITIGGMYWDRFLGSNVPELQRELRDQQFESLGQRPPEDAKPENADPQVLYRAGRTGFPITLGPGLVEAYNLETKEAKHPRVIASARLCQWLNSNGTSESCFPVVIPSPQQPHMSLRDLFRELGDKHMFFDVVHPSIARDDTEMIVRTTSSSGETITRWERGGQNYAGIMAQADRLVSAMLDDPNCPENIRPKYEWLKSYVDKVREEKWLQ